MDTVSSRELFVIQLVNMPPSLTGDDVGDCGFHHSVSPCYRPVTTPVSMVLAYRSNHFGVQPCIHVVHTDRTMLPPLAHHVHDVVFTATFEQMRRVAAWRVVASVKDAVLRA